MNEFAFNVLPETNYSQRVFNTKDSIHIISINNTVDVCKNKVTYKTYIGMILYNGAY